MYILYTVHTIIIIIRIHFSFRSGMCSHLVASCTKMAEYGTLGFISMLCMLQSNVWDHVSCLHFVLLVPLDLPDVPVVPFVPLVPLVPLYLRYPLYTTGPRGTTNNRQVH